MSKLTAAIIEDEYPLPACYLPSLTAASRLGGYRITRKCGGCHCLVQDTGSSGYPVSGYSAIGWQFIRLLTAAQPSSLIIFTTAYDQYAIRAFTVNSIDYILKPVDEKRLLDAIVKYETLKGKDYKQENYIGDLIQSLQKQEKSYRTRFLIAGVDKFGPCKSVILPISIQKIKSPLPLQKADRNIS